MALLAFPGHSGKKSACHSHCLLPSPFQGLLTSKAAKYSHWKASAGLAVRLGTIGSQDRLRSCLGTRPQFTTFGSNSHFEMAFPCPQWLLPCHSVSDFCGGLQRDCHFLCWSCWQPRGGIGRTGQWLAVSWTVALSTAWKSCHVWYGRVWCLEERFLWDLDEIWAVLSYPQKNLSKQQL